MEALLTSLGAERNVAASTQTQALSALLFLYKEVLGLDLPWLSEVTRAKRPARLPTVLSRDEVNQVFRHVDDPLMDLIVRLLYGTGMRLLEGFRLRVKDVNFEYRGITVREGKGGKDRVTVLPASLVERLRRHLLAVRAQHGADLAQRRGEVWLPDALTVKYPNAAKSWGCGSTCSRPWAFPVILGRARCAATTSTKSVCNARCETPPSAPAS